MGITVEGCYNSLPMDNISMCSNTVYMSNKYDVCGKQFEVAVSLNHDVMTVTVGMLITLLVEMVIPTSSNLIVSYLI